MEKQSELNLGATSLIEGMKIDFFIQVTITTASKSGVSCIIVSVLLLETTDLFFTNL